MHKSFFERFLPPKRKKTDAPPTPETALADLHAALTAIETERRAAGDTLTAHAAERRHMLLGDAPDDKIAAHDLAGDRARIQLERLDHAEEELRKRIEIEQEEVEDDEFREFLSRWRDAAVEHFEATEKARAAQSKFLSINASAPTGAHARLQMFEPQRIIPPVAALSRHVSFVIARENERLAANAEKRAAKRAAENEVQ